MDWNLAMASDEREHLIRRAERLRRLHQQIDDGMARSAITAEIAKHEALIAEIDSAAASEKPPADPEDIAPKTPPDIVA
jgi:hypothetical protein